MPEQSWIVEVRLDDDGDILLLDADASASAADSGDLGSQGATSSNEIPSEGLTNPATGSGNVDDGDTISRSSKRTPGKVPSPHI